MSIARACQLRPLQEIDLPVNKTALVVGGGIAGMTCALSIANQGHEVHLLEKDSDLGGTARKIHSTLDGLDVQAYLRDLVRSVYQHPSIHVHTDDDAVGTFNEFAIIFLTIPQRNLRSVSLPNHAVGGPGQGFKLHERQNFRIDCS